MGPTSSTTSSTSSQCFFASGLSLRQEILGPQKLLATLPRSKLMQTSQRPQPEKSTSTSSTSSSSSILIVVVGVVGVVVVVLEPQPFTSSVRENRYMIPFFHLFCYMDLFAATILPMCNIRCSVEDVELNSI